MGHSELWNYDFFIEYSDNDIWKNPRSDTHFHKSYEIYYLIENVINYFVDSSIYHIVPGTIMVIPPNKIHTTKSVNEKIRKRYLINLPENYIEEFLHLQPTLLSQFSINPIVFKDSDRLQITNLFEQLLREFEQKDANTVMIKSLLGILLVYISRQASTVVLKTEQDMKTTKKLMHIVRYINENFQNNLSLDFLSAKFFLNSSYISRTFKKELNISFSEYLRTVRIRAACKMLTTTDMSITEIADKVGFQSCTDFCRVFKSMAKLSPLQYRKENTE